MFQPPEHGSVVRRSGFTLRIRSLLIEEAFQATPSLIVPFPDGSAKKLERNIRRDGEADGYAREAGAR